MKSITFEAYYYRPGPDGQSRERSERQDLTFSLEGDTVVVYAPPPIAAVLYVVVPPERFLELLREGLS